MDILAIVIVTPLKVAKRWYAGTTNQASYEYLKKSWFKRSLEQMLSWSFIYTK